MVHHLFVRVGSDGNIDLFDKTGKEIFGFYNDGSYSTITSGTTENYINFTQPISSRQISGGPNGTVEFGEINSYANIMSRMYGLSVIAGSPDLRIGVTAADASPITIFSSTASGVRYEVKARILATAGTSATYTISWTEGGAVRTVALTVTAVGTEVHDNFVIAPDAGTNITAQITSLTSSTVNVDAIVSVLG